MPRSLALFLALLALLGSVRPSAGGEERAQFAGEVGDLVLSAIQKYNAVTAFPLPSLDAEQLNELLDGKVVRIRWRQPVPVAPGEEAAADTSGTDEGDGPKERHRVVALFLIEQPRVNVWLAALDPHMVVSPRVTEVRISNNDGRWYQLMDLPWPVRNRHWVIDVTRNVQAAEATHGLVWEEPWYLVPDGEKMALRLAAAKELGPITLDKAEGARYLDANTGAWAMIELAPNLTLLAYQLTVVLGGLLPEGLTARFASRELDNLCRTVAKNAAEMPDHYVAGHEVLYGGDGKPIEPPLPRAK